jgi:hypothetical protein
VYSHLTHTDSLVRAPSILVLFSFAHYHCHSKPIARPFQSGFLQVAVSKTLRLDDSTAHEALFAGAFPIHH